MKSNGTIMRREIEEIPKIMDRLLSSQDEIEAITKEISEEDFSHLIVAGRGTSRNAGNFLKNLVEVELGLPVSFTSLSTVSIYKAEPRLQKALVIAISQSGQSPDLNLYLDSAKRGGAKILVITNDPNSPAGKKADYLLHIKAGIEEAVAATKSYTASLLTLYLMIKSWAGNVAQESKVVTEAERVASEVSALAEFEKELNPRDPIIFLGRGSGLANALEGALKIQETSKISVESYSAAEYLHGPISSLNEKSQVIFIFPKGTEVDGVAPCLHEVRKKKARIFWIGDGSLSEGNEKVLPGSQLSDEELSTIIDSILIQNLALTFALSNGFDPDFPEGLTKVTKTL